MTLLLNSAGVSAADPILSGLPIELTVGVSTMDVASITDVYVDQNTTFAGTNSIKSSLSPAATVLTSGTAGSYNDTSKNYTISSTTGLTAGDYLYLSHASLTAGLFKIASVVDATNVTITGNPLNGLGNKTSISYQVAWRYNGTVGTSPISGGSIATGQIFYLKGDMADTAGNHAQTYDSFYGRTAPAGSSYIALQGATYTGATGTTQTPTLSVLAAWTNNGGIYSVELANHSVQARNDFTWTSGGGTAEKTISAAESSGLTVANIAGAVNYGALRFRSLSASANYLSVDIDYTVDLTAPTLVFQIKGR